MRLDLDALTDRDARAVGDQPRDAAVLAPVIERDGGHHLLFIERSEELGEHPGQMSFPGGGVEPGDADLEATALREAEEEIGLDPAEATIVGRLHDIRTVTRYAVSPFVGTIPDREYHPDGVEAIEVAVLPVADLTDAECYEYERRDHPKHGEIVVHYFRVDGYTVWGATGRILVDLLERTTDWRAPERSGRDLA